MVAIPSTAVDFTLLTAAKKIRFREAMGITNNVRNAREFGIVPSAGIPSAYRVQAEDGSWSFTGQAGNNTAALINAAYQRAINEGFSLLFDFEQGKYYWLESPLICFEVNEGTNAFVRQDNPALIGNSGYLSAAGEQAIQFIATHDLPIIITQGGNGFTIKNLWLRTLSNFASTGYASATTLQRFTDHTLWNSPNLRHNRWSPSCCIAVDPFGPDVPEVDRYPGLEEYYSVTASASSSINILNCSFLFNRVGILLGAGVGQNTDGILIRDCTFSNLKYDIVTCHAQTQNVTVDHCGFVESWACFANSVHGYKSGRWPGVINSANSSYIANIYGGEGLTDGLIHPDWLLSFEGGNSNWEDIGRIIYTSYNQGGRSSVSIRNATFAFAYTGTPQIKTGRITEFANCDFIMNEAGQQVWLDNQCPEDLPSGWDTGYCGANGGAETQFNNCNFYTGGSDQNAVSDVIGFGSLATGRKNWFKFSNCKARIVVDAAYYPAMLNCRGGAIT